MVEAHEKPFLKLTNPETSHSALDLYSIEYIPACVKANKLLNPEPFSLLRPETSSMLGPGGKITAAPVIFRTPSTSRVPFTAAEDNVMREAIIKARERGMNLGGNVFWKEFAAQHPSHPWQSWRDRANKRIMPTLKNTPARSNSPNVDSDEYTPEEDKRLESAILHHFNAKLKFNMAFFEEFANKNPTHTTLSWRSRAKFTIIPSMNASMASPSADLGKVSVSPSPAKSGLAPVSSSIAKPVKTLASSSPGSSRNAESLKRPDASGQRGISASPSPAKRSKTTPRSLLPDSRINHLEKGEDEKDEKNDDQDEKDDGEWLEEVDKPLLQMLKRVVEQHSSALASPGKKSSQISPSRGAVKPISGVKDDNSRRYAVNRAISTDAAGPSSNQVVEDSEDEEMPLRRSGRNARNATNSTTTGTQSVLTASSTSTRSVQSSLAASTSAKETTHHHERAVKEVVSVAADDLSEEELFSEVDVEDEEDESHEALGMEQILFDGNTQEDGGLNNLLGGMDYEDDDTPSAAENARFTAEFNELIREFGVDFDTAKKAAFMCSANLKLTKELLAADMDVDRLRPEARCWVFTEAEDEVVKSDDSEEQNILAEEKGGRIMGARINALRLRFLL